MIVRLIRFLRGYVVFSAKGKFTERLINILNKKGFLYWDIIPDDGGLSVKMPVKEYKNLRFYLNNTGIKTRVTERHGLPFLAVKYKCRAGLLIGAFLFVILLSVFSKFIWITTISGNNEIPVSKITEALNKNGVHMGVYRNSINIKATERNIIRDLPDIRWISINLTGSKAEVEIKEKYKSPKIVNKNQPSNIKSTRDAVIVKTNIKNGTGMTKPGSAVIEGQLLISGVVETQDGESRLVNAEGEIFGRTHYERTYKLPKKRIMAVPGKDSTIRNRGNFLWMSVPLSFTHINYDTYKSITKTDYFTVNNVNLPVSMTRQYISELQNKEISLKEYKKSLETFSRLNEAFSFRKKDIEKREVKFSQDKKYYYMKVKYTVVENLAKKSKIIVQN